MKTANFENSKKLYELSGWHDLFIHHQWERLDGEKHKGVGTSEWIIRALGTNIKPENTPYPYMRYPAYDLGYLVRKIEYWFLKSGHNGYKATFVDKNGDGLDAYDLTPEDAVATLVIQMFEKGYLSKDAK